MKAIHKFVAAAAVAGACALPMQSANAWWGPGWGGGPWNNSGMGDMFGDGDFDMSFRGRGTGRGYGSGYGYNNPYYGYGPYYGGGPGWGAPYYGGPAWGAPYGYGAYPGAMPPWAQQQQQQQPSAQPQK